MQLTDDNRCRLFGRPERPAVCSSLKPTPDMCGSDPADAFARLRTLEQQTAPAVNGDR